MGQKLVDFKFSVMWNLVLLTVGSILYIVGMNGVIIHHSFIPGGLYGACLMVYYQTGVLSPGLLFFLINIPLCILGWFLVSKRFVYYSIYSVCVITLASEYLTIDFAIHEQVYAAVAGGFICGAGSGILLRSLGSAGGLDILAIIINKYFNIGIGKFYLVYNCILFCFVISSYSSDIVIASIILIFIMSNSLDYFLSLFNQRKITYIISDQSHEIAKKVMEEMKIGATFIRGKGAYSGKDKDILMAITNPIQLKRLEEAVFTVDAHALFIVENSYDVVGSSFRKRKIY